MFRGPKRPRRNIGDIITALASLDFWSSFCMIHIEFHSNPAKPLFYSRQFPYSPRTVICYYQERNFQPHWWKSNRFGHPFLGDVLLVCVDWEGWQGNFQVSTSNTGITTIMDARHLADLVMNDRRQYNLPRYPSRQSQNLYLARHAFLLDLFFRVPATGLSVTHRKYLCCHRP